MKLQYPSYYPLFQCTAASCRHSCCIGWEIDIDPETAALYQSIPGPMGEELRRAICRENPPHFRLREDGRCPFLNEEGLCRLILAKGQGILCEICAQHPRFHNPYGNLRESGLGLCCEEAGRLLFTHEPGLLQSETTKEPSESDPDWLPELLEVRETAFSLALESAYSITERLFLLLCLGADVQDALDEGASLLQAAVPYREEIFRRETLSELDGEALDPGMLDSLLSFFQNREPLDKEWPARLAGIRERLGALVPLRMLSEDREAYERLIFYFLFRYLLDAGEDRDFLSKIKFAVAAVAVISLLDAQTRLETGGLSLENRIENARIFSSETEYSPDAMEDFWNACWEEEFLSFSALAGSCS